MFRANTRASGFDVAQRVEHAEQSLAARAELRTGCQSPHRGALGGPVGPGRGQTLEQFQKTRNARIVYSVAGREPHQGGNT